MRLMGTEQDAGDVDLVFGKDAGKELINILEKSRQYLNRGESKLSKV
ncbi:MAG TPA: hypothetical protein V6D12_06635 [Candidatus Obscuribacterales bacterium]